MKIINIVVIATNSYFILGLRFINNFNKFYTGNNQIVFHFFSDDNPLEYINYENVKYYNTSHNSWREATNSKFINILTVLNVIKPDEYVFYFDADTNVTNVFNEHWFLGDLVGGEHYANTLWMKDLKNYDRNPYSKAYVPLDTMFEQIYYYGAFFGGNYKEIFKMVVTLIQYQIEDGLIRYEPTVNDESYINKYFHYNSPTKIIKSSNFQFLVSDKGGLDDMRNFSTNIDDIKNILKNSIVKDFKLINGILSFDNNIY